MNLYTIVTNDAYELPVLCDVRAKEAAEYLHTTPGGIQRMICRPPRRSAYKPVITGRISHDPRSYYRHYSQTHDRTEYFRRYYQVNKLKIKGRRKKTMKTLNSREIEVLGILAAAGQPQTSTQIVNGSKELTQSTVQAVLRKLLAAGHVTVQGVTHSGNVLSRTFGITEEGRAAIRKDFANYCRRIRDIISVREAIEILQNCAKGTAE